jgi:hypothetical protein
MNTLIAKTLIIALVWLLRAQYGVPVQPIAAAPLLPLYEDPPAFSVEEEGPPIPVAGMVAQCLRESAEVQAAASALSDRNRVVHALALRFDASQLRAALGVRARVMALGHDLLFLANPDTKDSSKWDPAYRVWDPQTQTLIVSPLEKRHAFQAFARIAETHRQPRGRDARRGHVTTLVDALLRNPTSHLFEAHWDNKDDTEFDGLIALDTSTGIVRVLMSNDFA